MNRILLIIALSIICKFLVFLFSKRILELVKTQFYVHLGLSKDNVKAENSSLLDGTVSNNNYDYNVFTPNTTVVFDDVGSFDNFPPFNNANNFLPSSPNRIKTEFLLYTRKNPKIEYLIHYKDANKLAQSSFNKNKKLKILIHGLTENRDTNWLHKLKDEILKIVFKTIILTFNVYQVYVNQKLRKMLT